MKVLVGYTGFVGSNLYKEGRFDAVYHSKNIEQAYGTKPDLLVYAGIRAEKYLADHAPENDIAQILAAQRNIEKIGPKKLVLISTIDVFKTAKNVDENAAITVEGLRPYGADRYRMELWVREKYPDALIIRLPGLFGKNIKKNFIYDFIHIIPSMLRPEKLAELSAFDPQLNHFYELQDNGFYKVHIADADKDNLKKKFRKLGFSALHFTDSRSSYQFYNLNRLWADMQTALKNGITLLHAAVQPVSAGELYTYLTGGKFVNELDAEPADYDFRTVYDALFGGRDGWLCTKETVLREIKEFVEQYTGNSAGGME